jgi:hypothetical protein
MYTHGSKCKNDKIKNYQKEKITYLRTVWLNTNIMQEISVNHIHNLNFSSLHTQKVQNRQMNLF